MRNTIHTLIISILVAATLAGCSAEDGTQPVGTPPVATPEEAPALPPAASMQFDFTFFDSGAGFIDKDGIQSSSETLGMFNWLNAVVRVAVINVAVATAFTPPTLAFTTALSAEPVFEAPDTFVWNYIWAEEPGHEVVINLRGRIDMPYVVWELRVSDNQSTPQLDEFLWFHGESSLVDDSGYWIFNDIGEGGEEVEMARIDWDVEAEDQRELVFENVEVGHDDYGDRLTYLVEATIISVRFHDDSEDLDADITWDEITGAGSLRVPDYNDGERACWDEQQQDVECPDSTS